MISGSRASSRLRRTWTVCSEQADVAVLDVPAVFAEVDGDAVGPSQLGQHGRPDRVRLSPAPGLAERGDMIDVDTESEHDWISPNGGIVRCYGGSRTAGVAGSARGVAIGGGPGHRPERRLGQDERPRGPHGECDPPLPAGSFAFDRHDPPQTILRVEHRDPRPERVEVRA